ncbi:hypothetical protein ABZ839_18060 [Streptomyces cellulosae]
MVKQELRVGIELRDGAPYYEHEEAWDSLLTELRNSEDLRDGVRRVEFNDRMLRGALPEALAITLGSGGLTAVSTAIVSWLHYQTSDIKIHVTGRAGREVTLEGARVREADRGQLQALASELIDQLGDDMSDQRRPTDP